MQIVLIGSGNVAFHLAKAFTEAQIPISQIFGRNTAELQKISEHMKGKSYSRGFLVFTFLWRGVGGLRDDAGETHG